MKPSRNRIPLVLIAGAVLLLGGCNLLGGGGGGSSRFISAPATLHPESDAFASQATRTYLWQETLHRKGSSDSLLADLSLDATRGADTVIGGDTLGRMTFAPKGYEGPVGASAVARLGFRPGKLLLDSNVVPDPGPDLPFPATPAVGWRLDTTFGESRFVRELSGLDTLKISNTRHECWAFAETTWYAGVLRGIGTTWMGPEGLVLHRSRWVGIDWSTGATANLHHQILAQ
ncbi:MAG TPA: hypothetical protein VHO02_07835 [Fibrobacteria bacterium]|nr:hypothetical protein [Fibrobacteria bacterium]